MNSMTALEGLTDDRLLGGRVALYQPAAGYRAAIDPVLLAASIPAREGETVLEIGAGVGGAALCLAARVPGIVVHGLEIQADLVDVAALNIDRNHACRAQSFAKPTFSRRRTTCRRHTTMSWQTRRI